MSVAIRSTKFYSGFTPQIIPGLALWLDAADFRTFTLSGSSVTTWADKSGNGRDASGFTGTGTYSSNGLNSRPTVGITATGTMRASVPINTFSSGLVMFLVYQKTGAVSTNGYDTLVTRTVNTPSILPAPLDYFTQQTPVRTRFVVGNGSTSYRDSQFTIDVATITTPTVMCMSTFASPYAVLNLSLNGTNTAYTLTTTTGTTPAYGDGAATFVYIGTRADSFTRMNGNISELIMYNAASFSTSDRQQVEGYLANKWGIQTSLPTSHPYRYFPPFLRALQPTDLSGCVAWYDVADQSMLTFSSGSNVNLVRDKSGNARDIAQSVVGQQPLLVSNVIGSNPILRFAQASTTVLSNASAVSAALSNGPASFMLLERNMTAPTGNPGPFGFNAGPNFGIIFQFNAGFTGSFQPYTLTGGQTFTSATGRFDYYNRTNTGSGAIGTVYGTVQTVGDNATGTYSGLFNVGRAPNGYISGDIGELIVYNSNLSEADRQRLEGYIGWKWGLQGNLPSTHPFRLYRPLVALFSPLSVPSAALWLDAADLSTITFSTGSNISTWADKSGRGFNATQVNSPTYNSATRSITFNSASAQFFTLADNALPSGNSSYAYFIVFSFFGNGAYGLVGGGVYGLGSQVCAIRNDGTGKIINYWWANDVTTTNAVTLNTTQICEALYTAGSTRSVSLNFTGISSGTPGTRSQGVSSNTVGKTYTTEYHNGTISEMIVYSAQPTFAQQQQLEGYLAWKWGLRSLLPISHPYYEFNP